MLLSGREAEHLFDRITSSSRQSYGCAQTHKTWLHVMQREINVWEGIHQKLLVGYFSPVRFYVTFQILFSYFV